MGAARPGAFEGMISGPDWDVLGAAFESCWVGGAVLALICFVIGEGRPFEGVASGVAQGEPVDRGGVLEGAAPGSDHGFSFELWGVKPPTLDLEVDCNAVGATRGPGLGMSLDIVPAEMDELGLRAGGWYFLFA